jgi:hypothetical protein
MRICCCQDRRDESADHTETPLLLLIFGDDPAAYERRRIHLPMGRLAKTREIVNAACSWRATSRRT